MTVPVIVTVVYFLSDSSCLLDKGDSTLQVPQATIEIAGYGSVVLPDSFSEQLVEVAGLQ